MGKERSPDVRPVGKVAFAAPGFEAVIPLKETVNSGSPVEIIVDGVTQECASALSEAFKLNRGQLLVDVSRLHQKFLDALRLANVFDVDVVGVAENGGIITTSADHPFQTPNETKAKILAVLGEVLIYIRDSVEVARQEGLSHVCDFSVRVTPDWGCTEAMPE